MTNNIHEILKEINLENGSNYKIAVLKKYSNNELLKRVLKMAYDRVTFTYGITMKNVEYTPEKEYFNDDLLLDDFLDFLEEKLCTREYTGNTAIKELAFTLEQMKEEDAKLIELILGRDLKLNLGKTQINKVFKDLIIKPPYMRCNTYSSKTSKKILYPAYINMKADGMFQYITVDQGSVTFTARSGEERYFQHLENDFKNFPDGVYVGELLVDNILDRSEANGFINSLAEDKTSVYVQLWDYITLEEFSRPKDKSNKTFYRNRFIKLEKILKNNKSDRIKLIPYKVVNNIQEALQQTSEWMNEGFEGSILKDFENIFIDHTSPTQLKLKLEISLEVRCTGFTEGTPGTKRESTFGAMMFENDEGTIKGRCSGFTDKQLEDFNSRRDELIGQIFEVQFNDLTKAEGHDYYALSHPRFIEFRLDRNDTTTLERAFQERNMAMELK